MDCNLTRSDIGMLYSILEVVMAVIIYIAFIWLKLFERYEESALDKNMVTSSMYTIMFKNLPARTSEHELKEHIEKVLELQGLPPVEILRITLGLFF